VSVPGLMLRLPIKTTNPLNGQSGNSRLAGIIRARARAKQKGLSFMLTKATLARVAPELARSQAFVVTLTRISAGTMDTDGLAASQKGVRDGIAAALGIDDGDVDRLRFRYAQRKGPPKQHMVEVLIEERRP
jgi:hypothetical protein